MIPCYYIILLYPESLKSLGFPWLYLYQRRRMERNEGEDSYDQEGGLR